MDRNCFRKKGVNGGQNYPQKPLLLGKTTWLTAFYRKMTVLTAFYRKNIVRFEVGHSKQQRLKKELMPRTQGCGNAKRMRILQELKLSEVFQYLSYEVNSLHVHFSCSVGWS